MSSQMKIVPSHFLFRCEIREAAPMNNAFPPSVLVSPFLYDFYCSRTFFLPRLRNFGACFTLFGFADFCTSPLSPSSVQQEGTARHPLRSKPISKHAGLSIVSPPLSSLLYVRKKVHPLLLTNDTQWADRIFSRSLPHPTPNRFLHMIQLLQVYPPPSHPAGLAANTCTPFRKGPASPHQGFRNRTRRSLNQ